MRPRRRRTDPGQSGPARLTRAARRVLSSPSEAVGTAVRSVFAVPVTALAAVTCLVVAAATPQQAMAATLPEVSPAAGHQQYRAAAGSGIEVRRDAFGSAVTPGAAGAVVVPEPGGAAVARPVAGTVPTAGGFGSRWVRGCSACSTNHLGLDFAAPLGTPVHAAMSGVVVSAGAFGGYGDQVLLQHGDGSRTRYGHLSRIDVRVGQTVRVDQVIGAVGSTGVSTGAHLHFEVILRSGPVDPAPWLRTRGVL